METTNDVVNHLAQKIGKIGIPKIENICQQLTEVWTNLWEEDEIEKREEELAKECASVLQDVMQQIYNTERTTLDNYVDRMEKLMSEMDHLQKHLRISIIHDDIINLPLHSMVSQLNKRIEKYRVLRDERLKLLCEMQEQEKTLCESLGMVPNNIVFSEIPTEDELKQMSNYLQSMEDEKSYRNRLFTEKRQLIIVMYEQLEIKPLLGFEKDVVSENLTDFKLTNENITRLGNLEQNLEQQVTEAKEEVTELKNKLKYLWHYLDEAQEYQQAFLESHKGYSTTVIKSLTKEIEQCQKKKKENISEIIHRMRKILVEEWDRCLISQEERKAFRFFVSDCFTEDLCELHELEIQQVRKFYETHESIFNLISKRQKLFDNLLELQERSKNFDRYYNRGGQLLQEEKERRTIKKDLPRIEEELKTLLKKYREDNGKPFKIFGKPVEDVINEQWDKHNFGKSLEKPARKIESDKKVNKTSSNLKRPCPTPVTSTNSIAQKMGKYTVGNSTPRQATSKTGVINSHPRNITVRRNCFKNHLEVDDSLQLKATYDEFEEELETNSENKPRSTLITGFTSPVNKGAILRELNTPTNDCNLGRFLRSVNTPVKSTPVKLSTPKWTPVRVKTPRTFPRATRQSKKDLTPKMDLVNKRDMNKTPRLTTARNKLPIFI